MFSSLLLSHRAHVIALQQPRGVAYLPNYVTLQCGYQDDCTAVLIKDCYNHQPIIVSKFITAAQVSIKNNIKLTIICIYIKSPNSIDSTSVKNQALNLIDEAMMKGRKIVICGDFNCTISSKWMKQMLQLFQFHATPQQKREKRTRGSARVIDFVLSTHKMSQLRVNKLLSFMSDHDPVLIRLQKVLPSKQIKTIPSSNYTDQIINNYLTNAQSGDRNSAINVWKKVLSKQYFKGRAGTSSYKQQCIMHFQKFDSLEEYKLNYYQELKVILKQLAKSRFSFNGNQDWFDTLQRVCKYDQYEKRDGSFANRCLHDGRITHGEKFNALIRQWYSSLSSEYPRLERETQFPYIRFDYNALEKYNRYCKAISVDGIGRCAFISKDDSASLKSKKINLLKEVTSKQFWNLEESKVCLVGRLIVLNKSHPETPKHGRYRPIRISSNIVKVLQSHLFPKLKDWASKNLKRQFGFLPAIGCEALRFAAFRKIAEYNNLGLNFCVVQIDLENAYDTVNNWILSHLIEKSGFWTSNQMQLWRFLVTNASTWFEGQSFYKINGLPQGSILSPLLFDLYINQILQQRHLEQTDVFAYADDVIIISKDIQQLSSYLKQFKVFCDERKLKINYAKSDFLIFNGKNRPKEVLGFPVKREAKYLGVHYNNNISIMFTMKKTNKKIKFLFSKFYGLLKQSDFRVRFNIWQIFVCPLHRMTLCLMGEPDSERSREFCKILQMEMRRSLKKFTLSPRYADNELFNQIGNARQQLEKAEKRIGSTWPQYDAYARKSQVQQQSNRAYVCRFHPDIDSIIRTINRFECLEHGVTLTTRHLAEHHSHLGNWNIHEMLVSEEKKTVFDINIINKLNGLKGQPKF